jgi:hypothetical protein
MILTRRKGTNTGKIVRAEDQFQQGVLHALQEGSDVPNQ